MLAHCCRLCCFNRDCRFPPNATVAYNRQAFPSDREIHEGKQRTLANLMGGDGVGGGGKAQVDDRRGMVRTSKVARQPGRLQRVVRLTVILYFVFSSILSIPIRWGCESGFLVPKLAAQTARRLHWVHTPQEEVGRLGGFLQLLRSEVRGSRQLKQLRPDLARTRHGGGLCMPSDLEMSFLLRR